jgi:hypothetical protein
MQSASEPIFRNAAGNLICTIKKKKKVMDGGGERREDRLPGEPGRDLFLITMDR